MRIEHLAIWVSDLERMASFYERYFNAKKGPLYHNRNKNFSSYFLRFGDGARLELMHKPGVPLLVGQRNERLGYVHMAVSVGSKEKVDKLTERLGSDGFEVVGSPRTTGDGYYESIVLDPEGNQMEITI